MHFVVRGFDHGDKISPVFDLQVIAGDARRERRALLSAKGDTDKAINYILNRWTAFTRFLDDGRICLSVRPVIA